MKCIDCDLNLPNGSGWTLRSLMCQYCIHKACRGFKIGDSVYACICERHKDIELKIINILDEENLSSCGCRDVSCKPKIHVVSPVSKDDYPACQSSGCKNFHVGKEVTLHPLWLLYRLRESKFANTSYNPYFAKKGLLDAPF